MIKVLFRKEIRELLSFYKYDRKRKQKRSNKALISYIVLYFLLFVIVGFSFFGMATLFASNIAKIEDGPWIYFAIMSLMTILIGAIIDCFSAYTVLYKPKDSDILLSLPIKPGDLLLSKMISLYLLGFIYSASVYVPMCLAYDTIVDFNIVILLIQLLNLFILPVIVVVLSCLIGYIIALFSKIFKGNSIITVFISLVFFGLYYSVMMRLNAVLNQIVESSLEIGNVIRTFIFPIYHLGRALSGEILYLIYFLAFVVIISLLCYAILSRSFISIMTSSTGVAKVKFKKEYIKSSSITKTLFSRELKHFLSSTIYMLNCGIGVFIMLGLVVLAVINKTGIEETILDMQNSGMNMEKFIPLALVLMGIFIDSTNAASAPSISLEGKSIWIVQSLPVKTYDVLMAKQHLHLMINIIPSVISLFVIGAVYKIALITVLLMICTVCAYIYFHGLFGLFLNLKRPVLEWMNEQVPVKQSMSVMAALFGGYIIGLLTFGLFSISEAYLDIRVFLLILMILFILLSYFLDRWIRNKGCEIFESL